MATERRLRRREARVGGRVHGAAALDPPASFTPRPYVFVGLGSVLLGVPDGRARDRGRTVRRSEGVGASHPGCADRARMAPPAPRASGASDAPRSLGTVARGDRRRVLPLVGRDDAHVARPVAKPPGQLRPRPRAPHVRLGDPALSSGPVGVPIAARGPGPHRRGAARKRARLCPRARTGARVGPTAEGMGPRGGKADRALDVRPAHLSRQLPRRAHPDRRGAARMGPPPAGAVPARRGLELQSTTIGAHDRRLGNGSRRARRPRVAVGSRVVAARPLGRHRGRRLGTRPRALRRDTAPSRSGRGGAPRDPGHRRRPVPGARRPFRDAGRVERHRMCPPRAAPCLESACIRRGGARRRGALPRAVERAHLTPGRPPFDAAARPSEPPRRRAARNSRLVPPPGLEGDARRVASSAWRRDTDSRPFAAREERRGLRARDPAPDSGSARPSVPGRPAGAGARAGPANTSPIAPTTSSSITSSRAV